MITGTVTAYREAIIRLSVRGPGGEEKTVEAVIDTGFAGIRIADRSRRKGPRYYHRVVEAERALNHSATFPQHPLRRQQQHDEEEEGGQVPQFLLARLFETHRRKRAGRREHRRERP